MDYTLIQYQSEEWERRAYEHLRQKLDARNWPVADLEFDPQLAIRGLILDLEYGNLVKANRFGYVMRACHGTRIIAFEDQRALYGRELIELGEERYVFLNTLFSLSEACMYSQLVDRLDAGQVPEVLGYADLYRRVRQSIDEAHMEGELKSEIMADPDRFVERDPELALTLLDQRHAGKKILLITNSEWGYTQAMMAYAFDPFLANGQHWRDLFDLVIVSARKPVFFSEQNPVFEVVNDEGLLRPAAMGIQEPGVYLGGNAAMVEDHLGVSGDEILYVGDHIYTDVHVSKSVLRWRTALVVRELEGDLTAEEQFASTQDRLSALMQRKEDLEFEYSQTRLALQRRRARYGPKPGRPTRTLERRLTSIRDELRAFDEEIAPLAAAAAGLGNQRWGPLMRAGNDKSHLARQVERSADIYMSRVSNFLYESPFQYLRAPRGPLPHDAVGPAPPSRKGAPD
jgi:HAD superfamily 5'-nucleotidase-like hydrolase